jgi:hypothetical protein
MRRMESALAKTPVAASPGLPFAHLNLRRNPFGEVDIHRRAEFAVVDIDGFVDRLREPNFALQFIGEKGHGKTTHLMALLPHFPDATYLHIGEGERPTIPRGKPLFIDEAQRVGPAERRRINRRGVPLVFGTHRNFQRELERNGREVVTVTPGDYVDVNRVLKILNRRIQWARRGPGDVPAITVATAQAMIALHGANIRAIEAKLYDIFQNLDAVRDV